MHPFCNLQSWARTHAVESERQCIYTCMLRVSILSLLLRFFLLDLGLFLQCGIIILFTLIVDGTFMGTYVKMTSPYLYSTIDSYTTISRLRCSDKCTSNEECRTFVYHEINTACILYSLKQNVYKLEFTKTKLSYTILTVYNPVHV
jgi:hypothetical protein